ncbi:phage tail protein [Streptomyces sp. RKND-216]|uniref:spherulation-specific family 4 protein n=1 Tax=Streptomyces sp. RKND-216 TaxID=2562581 RepID=UPI00109DF180|nr:spherulation-specific family 4 protein [Streptomyces sp. RKND-216]THA24636.1 phage tail protein [Streptomyces sp. RKND-216]
MPHLTTPGVPAATGAPAARIGLAAPGWAHPMLAPREWREPARAEAPPLHWAVLNVGRGPGARPDPYCLAAAARLREAGTPVLGHLELRQGFRPFAELVADARRFLDWYGVSGFYLARCPSDPAHLHETRRTTRTLRALSDGGLLVLGHGTHPYPGYAKLADQLVTFEGGWPDYRWSQVAEWTADHPPERFCHLVHGVPGTHLEEALRIARWQGAGTVYFTDRGTGGGVSPWESLPGYWDEIVSRLGTGVSE